MILRIKSNFIAMKNLIVAALLLLVGLKASAQIELEIPNRYTYRYLGFNPQGTFRIPYGTTPRFTYDLDSTRPGAVFYRTTDSTLLRWTGRQWLAVGGSSGVGLSQLTDSLNTYVKDIKRSNDSVFKKVNNAWVFAYKDSTAVDTCKISNDTLYCRVGGVWKFQGKFSASGIPSISGESLIGNWNLDGVYDLTWGGNTPIGNTQMFVSSFRVQSTAAGSPQIQQIGRAHV